MLAVLVAVASLLLWRLFSSTTVPSLNVVSKNAELTQPSVAFTKPKTKPSVKASEDEGDDFNPYDNEEIKASLQQAVDLYEETSKYPVTSQPVFDPAAVREPEPFEFTEVDLPFPEGEDDENPIRIAAATNTYQYFQGDTISARIQISGAPEDTFIDVNGVLSGANGDVPLPLNFQASNRSLTEFTAEFDTNLAPPRLMTPEMVLKLGVTVDGRDLSTTVTFRYDIPSARVVAAQPSRVEGPNLVMPLQISVGQSGYYFIRGVLEDAATRRPLLELQQEGPLQLGNGLLNLNAHIAALSRQGSEGPYILRSVKLHRGAETGESLDAPGASQQTAFQIQGFPFSSYQQEEYVDELAQERIDFLRDIGGVNEDDARDSAQDSTQNEGTPISFDERLPDFIPPPESGEN